MAIVGPGLSFGLPLLAMPAILATWFALGIGLALAPVAVRFPDAIVLVGILLTLVTYLAPVFYPLSIVPSGYRWIVEINPLTCYIDGFRAGLYDQSLGTTRDLVGMVAYAGVSVAIGAVVFTRLRQSSQIHLT
jgi:ABC-type polysaccharide/polyol phosphate export permease